MEPLFPSLKKSISSLIEDEEGNVPANKLLVLGTMVVVIGALLSFEAFAAHSSHRSHSSHKSHSSHSSGTHGSSHESHVSHQSHTSSSQHTDHASHLSHTSHSNDASHYNSRFSAEGDVSYAPPAYSIQGVPTPPVSNTPEVFQLPDINQNIEIPNSTPGTGIVPGLAIPSSTLGVKIDAGDLKIPPATGNTD